MADVNFNDEAQKILKELQQLLDKEDSQIFEALPPLCKQFLIFYNNYYQQENRTKQGLYIHQKKLQNLINIDQQSPYVEHKATESISTLVTTLANSARKLESLLTGFKTVFLKTLGYNYVQQIVIENEDYIPIIIQLENFSGMENFIRSSLLDFEGKLKTNKQMLQFINNKNHSDLYSKIYVQAPYNNIYKETRRRLNIFYTKIKKGKMFGEGLLLYKPHQQWIKFYVTTLGDVKEGFVSMVSAQAALTHHMEYDIQLFAEQYIGKVNNIAGTLFQDVQNLEKKLQISVKSNSAKTGSHDELIEIITQVASGNLEKIREVFTSDEVKAKNESGQRNRVFSDKESKEKIAQMMSKLSDKKAREAVAEQVLNLQADNVLVQVEKQI